VRWIAPLLLATAALDAWELSVDLLYWQAREHRLDCTNKPSVIGTTVDFTETDPIAPHFEWDVGFRERFAYTPSCEEWEFSLEWTHIKNRAHEERSAHLGEASFPVWVLAPDAFVSDFIFHAEEHWKIDTNIFDAYFSYCFAPLNWLQLMPGAGLRGAILNQSTHIDYEGGIFPSGTDKIRMRNNYWGVGPRIGLDVEFLLDRCQRWTIFASGAGAMLLGKIEEKQNEHYFNTRRFHRTQDAFKLRWVVDFKAGIQYRIPFCCEQYAVTFKAGWEFHDFFRQNMLPQSKFHLLTSNRDLTYRGWFFTTQFSF